MDSAYGRRNWKKDNLHGHLSLWLKEFLNGYEGFIQADGLATYNAHLKETPEILLTGCLAHTRQKFENSFKASNEKSAEKILFTIKKLYDVEKKIRNHDYYKNGNFEEIVKIRQRESKPLMDHLYNQILVESQNPKKSNGLNPQDAAIEFFTKLLTCNTSEEAETLFKSILGWG
ncbi:MAG: transposase [Leptospiraceae bacterium]|nr:transposase [Leptospiraceae bacterium]